jgi:hypothetical protein
MSEELDHAMKKAAEAVEADAVQEAAETNADAGDAAAGNPLTAGIPQAVIDSLSTANLVHSVRAALEKLASVKIPKDAAPEEKVEAEAEARIQAANKVAMQDPDVQAATEKAVQEVVRAKMDEMEAQTNIRARIQKAEAEVQAAQQGKAKAEATVILANANKEEMRLSQAMATAPTIAARNELHTELLKAQQNAHEASQLLHADHSEADALQVGRMVSKVMAEGEAKKMAQLRPAVEAKVKTEVLNKVVKEAKERVDLAVDEAAKDTSQKVDLAMAKEKRHLEEEDGAVADDTAMNMDAAMEKVQGYYGNRRRFAAQKHYVQFGKIGDDEKTPEEKAEDRAAAEKIVQNTLAKDKAKWAAEKEKDLAEAVDKALPAGAVTKMVSKLAVKESKAEADQLASEGAAEPEEKAIAGAVQDALEADEGGEHENEDKGAHGVEQTEFSDDPDREEEEASEDEPSEDESN